MPYIIRLIVVSLVVLLLQGCGERRTQLSKQSCTSYGFSPGTTAYAQCVQNEIYSRKKQVSDALNRLNQNNNRYTTNCTKWGSSITCTTN